MNPAWNAMRGSSALSKVDGTATERAVRYVLNCGGHTVRSVERWCWPGYFWVEEGGGCLNCRSVTFAFCSASMS